MIDSFSVEGLSVSYGKRRIIDNFSISLGRGGSVSLIGPNGSGKSTVLKALCGVMEPSCGKVFLNGAESSLKELRRHMGYCPQESAIFPKLSVRENLLYFANLYGVAGAEASVEEKMKVFGLARYAEELVERLSGGLKRRVNIAVSFVHDPSIVLLDEPTIELDPYARSRIWKVIRKVNLGGVAVIVSTNMIEEAMAITENSIVIESGSARFFGESAGLARFMR